MKIDQATLKALLALFLTVWGPLSLAFLSSRLSPMVALAAVLAAASTWGLARRDAWLAAATAFSGVVMLVVIADLIVQVHVQH